MNTDELYRKLSPKEQLQFDFDSNAFGNVYVEVIHGKDGSVVTKLRDWVKV